MSDQQPQGQPQWNPQWGQQQPQFQPPAGYELVKKKNWFLRHKITTGVLGLFAVGIIGSAAGAGSQDPETVEVTQAAADTQAAPAAKAPVAKPAAKAPAKAAAPAPAAKPAAPKPAPKPAAPSYAGAQEGDKVADSARAVKLSGWTTTAGPLHRVNEEYIGTYICTTISMVNRDDEKQSYGIWSWKLQSPSGDVQDATFTARNGYLLDGELVPGGSKTGEVCFDDIPGAGTYVLFWQPDVYSSEDRGVWVNKL